MNFFLFTAVIVASASATSFYEKPFPDTVKSAAQIVRGKVGKSESQWATLPDGSKHLFTYYEVEVTEGLKGKPKSGGSIRIRELGGEKDGVTLQVSGTAHFGVGEDIVVMLGEGGDTGDRAYPLMGMMMGKFNIEKGVDGKEYLKGPGIGSTLHPSLRNENSATGAQVSLDYLRELIRKNAEEGMTVRPIATAPVTPREPLLSSKANSTGSDIRPVADESLTTPFSASKNNLSLKPYLLGIGMILGALWFLKSKMKRR